MSPRKQPDRWERMVGKLTNGQYGPDRTIRSEPVVALLRREHAAMEKQVRKLLKHAELYPYEGGNACLDTLAWLDKRRR